MGRLVAISFFILSLGAVAYAVDAILNPVLVYDIFFSLSMAVTLAGAGIELWKER